FSLKTGALPMKNSVRALMVLLITAVAPAGFASDEAVVRAFYDELLSQPNRADMESSAAAVLTEKWVSIPTPRGGPDRTGFVATLQGFGAAIPNLNWAIQEILQDGNRYIVRSIATGTPEKPMFGIPPSGKSFKIMTIDIHTVEGGLITQSYHVEEWAKAMQQLSAE
ncbi:MAG: ester cyclase, partial [Pseudomonadota bacterium]